MNYTKNGYPYVKESLSGLSVRKFAKTSRHVAEFDGAPLRDVVKPSRNRR